MKYKVIGLVVCLAVLASSVLIPLISSNDHQRYHQHLEAKPKVACHHDNDVFCTHLPLVEIETGGREIPGRPIYNETNEQITGYTTAADGSEFISAHMEIKDSETTNNHQTDPAALRSHIQIHVRGNSSRTFDKRRNRHHQVSNR